MDDCGPLNYRDFTMKTDLKSRTSLTKNKFFTGKALAQNEIHNIQENRRFQSCYPCSLQVYSEI